MVASSDHRGGAARAQGDLQRTTRQRLGSWRVADPNPCGWEGISCSFPDLRIQSIGLLQECWLAGFHGSPIPINLPYMQLGGVISPSIGRLIKLQRLPRLFER